MNLMFPKPEKKKKRKTHRRSIIQNKAEHYCFLCALLKDDYRQQRTEEHHVYMGINRQVSEANGFKVYLCLEDHRTGKDAVHNNRAVSDLLKVMVQREYEKNHTREEFMKLTKRNHIWEERGGLKVGQKVRYKNANENPEEGIATIYSFAWLGSDELIWLEDDGRPHILVSQKDVTPYEG